MLCIIQVARKTRDTFILHQVNKSNIYDLQKFDYVSFLEIECVFVILNWKISLCVFSCDRTTKEVTVNGFEDILTVDGSIKRANGIKNIDICDFWMWKYFQTNHMLLGSMKAYFFGRQILNSTYHTKFYLYIDICHIKHQSFLLIFQAQNIAKTLIVLFFKIEQAFKTILEKRYDSMETFITCAKCKQWKKISKKF